MTLDSQDIGMTRDFIERSRSNPLDMQALAPSGGIHLHVLSAGSKGNAAIIENSLTGEGVLVDCGISKKTFMERCDEAGFDIKKLKGILITHEHSDHTKGLGVVTRGLAKVGVEVPLITSAPIAQASSEIRKISDVNEILSFEEWVSKTQAGMNVIPFATSHDSVESYGFRFEANGEVLGFITDSGFVTPEAHDALLGSTILALETNHDKMMLQNGPYPYVIKKRIASNEGHLSNVQAAEELELLLSDKLRQVICMHISENNNTYRLPVQTLVDVVERNCHGAKVCCSYQNRLVSL